MQALHAFAAQMADSDVAILILGETGVGKSFARAIHDSSPRRNKRLITTALLSRKSG
jgi:transcriptional regulator with GAF, ATPase, and Fis domain